MNLFFVKSFVILLNLLLPINNLIHPIHLSVCEMNFNSESRSIEIAVKVFFDDLEDGVVDAGGPNLHLFTEKEIKESDQWILKYFQDHLKLKIDQKDVGLHWVGKETDPKKDIQSLWVYLEVKNIKKVKSLEVENSILFDVHTDQRNMLHLTCNDKKVSWLFDLNKISETIQW